MIYLISEAGAATANNESGAQMLEAVGYRRCTRAEYRQMIHQIRRKDAKAAGRQMEKERR